MQKEHLYKSWFLNICSNFPENRDLYFNFYFFSLENLRVPEVRFRGKRSMKSEAADASDRLSISASTFSLFDEQDGGATNEGTEIENLLHEHEKLDEDGKMNGKTGKGNIILEETSETGMV